MCTRSTHLRPPPEESGEDFYVRRLLGPKLAFDLHCVRHRTLLYDLRLLFPTVWVVLFKMIGWSPRWQPPVPLAEAQGVESEVGDDAPAQF